MTTESVALSFLRAHPQEAARVLERFSPIEISTYLEPLPADVVSGLFRCLSPTIVSGCFENLDTEKSVRILREMGVERASVYLRRMHDEQKERVLGMLSGVYAGMLRMVLRYPEGTIGQYMDPDVVTVNQQARIRNVIDLVRANTTRLENEIYVVDDQHKIAGVVDVKDLLTADPDEPVMRLMQRPRYCVPARSRLEAIGAYTRDGYRDYYPVIDHNNNFVGILRRETLYDKVWHRKALHQEEADLISELFMMADLFMKTILNLLIPRNDRDTKRGQDEQ